MFIVKDNNSQVVEGGTRMVCGYMTTGLYRYNDKVI